MKAILETQRMVFQPFTPDDFGLLFDLHSDPEVQRYFGGGPYSREAIQARLDLYVADQARYGYSKWKAYLRDGTFVGRAGVSVTPGSGAVDLGYSFARAAWGHGLASEAATAVVHWIFTRTAVTEIVTYAHVDNIASRRVLEKVGMVFEEERDHSGLPHAFYRLTRPEA